MSFNFEYAKAKMEEHGINQVKLSKLTGIQQSLLSKYLRGEVKDVSADNLYKIAAALKIHFSDLLLERGRLYKDGNDVKPSVYFSDFEPVIEKNVPYEKPRKGQKKGKFRIIFDKMELGDSFTFEGNSVELYKFKQGMRGAANRSKEYKVGIAKEGKSKLRFWKIKGKQNGV